ncbi:erythromycin esterase family protein [Stackebrandtia nassauensis]|uniref:Erythromycin esterase n=1 Tax=Stackebrandtia nassauensis (strain DSM 44728 / CIP 108903 / NRRL B-16338 / NBRC 102104 / LLR-40K-21) TaxID=446470 RepID=D3PU60_STANL|nr:erythromycin esterase family protein [Stackebrandtia nassauensis]ADD41006.1 Erythromycin esterase [Stackebrandtia nassauensis DSM 44728]
MPTAADVRDSMLSLDGTDDLDPLLRRARSARFVLIGEASHGGHEYYAWRAAITRRLIAEHGFSFVAVEGDGPDCRRVDASVRSDSAADPGDVLEGQRGWPSWLWANEETIEFCRWLRQHNAELPHRQRVGWYGLDAHPLHASIRTVVDYLRDNAPDYVDTALGVHGRGKPLVPAEHLESVTELLTRVHEADAPDDEYAAQDAKLRAGAEGYYNAMLTGGSFGWNTRVAHMVAVLEDLADHHGPNARAVVWAHNTHVGDARATAMAERGEHNLGEFMKDRHGVTDVFTVGFAGGQGEVIAVPVRGEPMRVMPVPPPRPGSLEALLADSGTERGLIFVDEHEWAREKRDQRAIGVVHDDTDDDHWVPTVAAERYNALCWFAATTPVRAVHLDEARRGELPVLR